MYFSDRVKLIGRKVTGTDGVGNQRIEETCKEVWAEVKSPGRAEATAAGTIGLEASAVVVVHVTDYKGQTAAEVDGRRLTVYRTYRKGEQIELYCTEKRGERHGN